MFRECHHAESRNKRIKFQGKEKRNKKMDPKKCQKKLVPALCRETVFLVIDLPSITKNQKYQIVPR